MHVLNLLLTLTTLLQATAHAAQPNRDVCLSPEQVVRDIANGRSSTSLMDDLANARHADKPVEGQLLPMGSKEIDDRLAEIGDKSKVEHVFRLKSGKTYVGTLGFRPNGQVVITGTDGNLYGFRQSELFSVYKSTEIPAVYSPAGPVGSKDIADVIDVKIDVNTPAYKGKGPAYIPYGNPTYTTFAGSKFPIQGYKLHVSPIEERAIDTAEIVLPLLRKLGVSHKVAQSLKIYARLKDTQVGKFITIYPSSPEQAKKIADEITIALQKAGFTPRDFKSIPGEAQVPRSLGVSTRYGVMSETRGLEGKIIKLNKNGHVVDAKDEELIINGKFATLDDLEAELEMSPNRKLTLEVLERGGFIVNDKRGTQSPSWAPPSPF